MMRVPVHKGIGNHSAPAAILAWAASRRLEPSDLIRHNTGTITTAQAVATGPEGSHAPVRVHVTAS